MVHCTLRQTASILFSNFDAFGIPVAIRGFRALISTMRRIVGERNSVGVTVGSTSFEMVT
jgi:hypothetical protein